MHTTQDIAERAAKAAGNWQRFESFGWYDQPEDPEQWCIVYTNNRDSGLLDQSNAECIAREMEPFIEDGTVIPEHHGHWACGWVDGYAIRVYADLAGHITPAFTRWCEIQDALEDHPVLDDDDYSNREHEAALESIEQRSEFCNGDVPNDWAVEVYSILPDRELENRDDQGAYPSDESIQEALRELGWLDPEYDDSIPWYTVRCPVCCECIDADELDGAIVDVPLHTDHLGTPCPGVGCRAPVEPNK